MKPKTKKREKRWKKGGNKGKQWKNKRYKVRKKTLIENNTSQKKKNWKSQKMKKNYEK